MTVQELNAELNKLGLGVVWDADRQKARVESRSFANPIIHFDAYQKEYTGTISVKSINTPLFTASQIKKAIEAVDAFLKTPLANRGL